MFLVLFLLFYIGIWMACTIGTIWIYKKTGVFREDDFCGEPEMVLASMMFWPITVPILLMLIIVRKCADMMEDTK